jgi:3-oxoacyl-[acyl-carrier protein] reductase
MSELRGTSILVTGGGSGIGAATALRLVRGGARVTIADLRPEKVEAMVAEAGPACRGVAGDVTSAADRARMMDSALGHGGGLNALVHCAGNMLRGPISTLDEGAVLDVFNLNVVAGMMLTGLAVDHLARDGGAVVFIGSITSRRAYPEKSPYTATQGAIEALTRALAAELGPRRITVNCVLPGTVPTDINIRAGIFSAEEHAARLDALAADHALKRIGRPDEVAEAIEYLIRAEWTTGTSLVVDGGLSLGISNR